MRQERSTRRRFVQAAAGVAAAAAMACTKRRNDPDDVASAPRDPKVVRVASVPTAVEGSVLPALVAAFTKRSSLEVVLTATEHVYDLAREGSADLAISHYGHRDAEAFVLDGLGEWPRTLFNN